MFSEEREQKLKERLLAAFELARTAKLKPKVPEAQKSKSKWWETEIRIITYMRRIAASVCITMGHLQLPIASLTRYRY